MNSDQREANKHTIRRLKTEIYEYESELKTLGNPKSHGVDEESKRRRIVVKLVINLRQQLVELEEPNDLR